MTQIDDNNVSGLKKPKHFLIIVPLSCVSFLFVKPFNMKHEELILEDWFIMKPQK